MSDFANEFMNLGENKNRIRNLIGRSNRLNVDIDEVRKFNPRLANYIKSNPIEGIFMFEEHLRTIVDSMQGESGKSSEK